MPQPPDLSRYLDAGAQFVAMRRTEARRRARDLVAAGQLAQEQVQAFVDDLVEESRRRTDEMTDVVRREIQRQMKGLGLATKDDLAKLEGKLGKQIDKQAKAVRKSTRAAASSSKATKAAAKPATKKAAKKAGKSGKKAATKKAVRSGTTASGATSGSAAAAS